MNQSEMQDNIIVDQVAGSAERKGMSNAIFYTEKSENIVY